MPHFPVIGTQMASRLTGSASLQARNTRMQASQRSSCQEAQEHRLTLVDDQVRTGGGRVAGRIVKTLKHEHYDPEWPPWRRNAAAALATSQFKCGIGSIIMFNMGLVVYDTDLNAQKLDKPVWLETVSLVLLIIYVLELALRFYVSRWSLFRQPMSVFDLYIVLSDVVFKLLGDFMDDSPSLSIMRVLRTVRIVRVFRSLNVFRELYLMMQGLFSALKAIFWATFLLFVVLTIFGILAVTYLQPLNQELADQGVYKECGTVCTEAFQTVMMANVYFVKTVIAGDSWGEVSMQLIKRHPFQASVILIGVLLVTQVAVMNLIVAVIVDKATEARQDDKELRHSEKVEALKQASQDLMKVFEKMDGDGSGSLSKQEIMEGFITEAAFADLLHIMDIGKEDLGMMFDILDKDRSGEIDYKEFIEQLHMTQSQDSHTLLIFIRHLCGNMEEQCDFLGRQLRENTAKQDLRNAEQDKQFHELKHLLEQLSCSNGTSTHKSNMATSANVQQNGERHLGKCYFATDSDKLQTTNEDTFSGCLEFFRLQVQNDSLQFQRQVEKDLGILSEHILSSTAAVVRKAELCSELGQMSEAGEEIKAKISSACKPGAVDGGHCYSHDAKLHVSCTPDRQALQETPSHETPKGEYKCLMQLLPPVPETEWEVQLDSTEGRPHHRRPSLADTLEECSR